MEHFYTINIISKDNNLRTNRQSCIFTFKDSWGEIDGYLPIMEKFKNDYSDWNIIVFFLSQSLCDKSSENDLLHKKLLNIADYLVSPSKLDKENKKFKKSSMFKTFINTFIDKSVKVFPSRIKNKLIDSRVQNHLNSLFERNIQEKDIKIIFKDHSNDTVVEKIIQKRCKQAKIVVYPHGTMLRSHNENVEVKEVDSKVDLILAGNIDDSKYYKKRFPNAEIVTSGHAKYDQWWIDNLLPKAKNEIGAGKRIFTFYTRDPNPSMLKKETYDYLMNSCIDVILQDENNYLIIKPHPRQNIDFIKKYLKKYDSSRWLVSMLPSLNLACISDFIVSMWSSCILDGLVAGKPVVEFYRFETNYPQFIELGDGKVGSIYQKLKLSISAQNSKELKELIDSYFVAEDDMWKTHMEISKRYLCLDNKSSQRAIDAVMNKIKNH